jgi:hypothetical protein
VDSLYQRLKELDSGTFEALCFHILKEKYPGLELRHVEGSGGDEGLDVFAGQLFGQPAIWQCKSFPNGVRGAQREQIKASLRSALKHFSVAHWILCISVDMDAKAHMWFEKFQQSHASQVKIGLFTASDFVHELIYRRSIRDHFFPGATIDFALLKRLILRTGEMTAEELEQVTDANAEDLVERMKERDARFHYQIVYDGDLGPPPVTPWKTPEHGLLMSLATGSKTINVFARDVQGLRSNPPSFQLSFKGAGVEKAVALWKTGIRQEFTSDELGLISTDLPLFSSFLKVGNPPARLLVTPPSALTDTKRSVRVTFRKPGAQAIEFPLMLLAPSRMGAEEAEFVCTSQTLFFEIAVVMSLPIDLQTHPAVTVRHRRYVGEGVRLVKKFLDAVALLKAGGELEFFDLEAETVFATIGGADIGEETPAERGFRQIVTDLAQIAERFEVDLRFPSDMSDEDLESVVFLKTLCEGATLPVPNISALLVKSQENRDLMLRMLTEPGGFLRLEHQRREPMPKLFGAAIDTGPFALEAQVQVDDLAAFLSRFETAPVGDGIPIGFRPMGPVRFLLLPKEELRQPQRLLFRKKDS